MLAGLGVVVMVVVVVPWTIRNQETFHELVPVSNNVGTALAGANCRLTYSGSALGSWRSTFGAGDTATGQCFTGFNGSQHGFNEARAAAEARHQGLSFARHHLGDLPKVLTARVLRTFGVFRPEQQIRLEALEGRPQGWERAGTWFEWVMYPLAAAGAVLLVRRRAPVWPLAAAVLSVLVATFAHLRQPAIPDRCRARDPRRHRDHGGVDRGSAGDPRFARVPPGRIADRCSGWRGVS